MVVNSYQMHIEWGDCDPARIVFYPNYFRWFDDATSRLFAAAGLPWAELFRAQAITGLPLVSISADFRTPSRYGDEITIESRISEWRSRTFVVSHRVSNGGELSVAAAETRAWVAPDPNNPEALRAIAIPEDIKRRFSPD